MTQTLTKPLEASSYTIAERLERLPFTTYQIKLFAVIATAFFFDCVDVAMMTFALSPIKEHFNLSMVQTGLLGSMTFIGMFIGALCAGVLADRFGRLRVFQWSMITWGIASLFCALAANIQTLMACRILLGIGMAMEPVAGQALLCELVPAKQRGKYMSYLLGLWPIGFIAAGLLAYYLLPIGGWRALFFAEAIPAIFVFVIRRNLPESPRWLEEVGKFSAATQVISQLEEKVRAASGGKELPLPVKLPSNSNLDQKNEIERIDKLGLKTLFQANYAKRTTMLWSLWFFALLGYYGLTTWLGALLTAKGFAMTKSSLYIVLISLAGIPGFFTLSKLVEKWGRKPSTIFTLIGSAISAYFYGNTSSSTEVIVFGLAMQFFMYGMWCAIYAYTPELYPTKLRATGAGFASAFGRLGALFGPYIVGIALPLLGQAGVFQLGAGAFIAAALITLILGEETKGKILEEIS